MSIDQFNKEVENNERFEFGKNWKTFLSKLDDQRIKNSEKNLKEMLKVENLSGKTFIDIGSGSGLSSLAARNLGAKVFSFDFDDSSVWCTKTLKESYYKNDPNWTVEQGSALDEPYLNSLNKFDIVYSWGVLHHTGDMWKAIDLAAKKVNDNGKLYIAIYNDQGWKSKFWWYIKSIYNQLPKILKKPYAYLLGFTVKFLIVLKYTILLKPMVQIRPMFYYKEKRGMSMMSDIVDWYGGFPYEYASYNSLKKHLETLNFSLVTGVEASSLGCHQQVYKKNN